MINESGFRKRLIDDGNKTIKQWCIDNGFDVDRIKNVIRGVVKATDEEIEAINKYAEG